jgi:hypothetical protein
MGRRNRVPGRPAEDFYSGEQFSFYEPAAAFHPWLTRVTPLTRQPACVGDYRSRLWFASTWPIALVVVAFMGFVVWGLAVLRTSSDENARARTFGETLRRALQLVLSVTLMLTFLVVPSISTQIFRTFLCDSFEYDGDTGEARRYLRADLTVSCESADYSATRRTAMGLLVLWPIGVPAMYALLIRASREALLKDISTPIGEATAFLSADYTIEAYWWEPVEMLRKLVLTGWVLLIGEQAEQRRVLIAILVSVVFLALRLTLQPLKR